MFENQECPSEEENKGARGKVKKKQNPPSLLSRPVYIPYPPPPEHTKPFHIHLMPKDPPTEAKKPAKTNEPRTITTKAAKIPQENPRKK